MSNAGQQSALSQGLRHGRVWYARKRLYESRWLYAFLAPAAIVLLLLNYWPMYGLQIAFKEFSVARGFFASPWVGLAHYERFFRSSLSGAVIVNTIVLSVFQLVVGFPAPIILALLLNQLRNQQYKKFVQTVTYAPYFIPIVVLVGMMHILLSPRSGVVNTVISSVGFRTIFFLGEPGWFRPLFVLSGVWQSAGWGAIIYLAALSSVNPELYEAIYMDGGGKSQMIRYIDFPTILPIITIVLILRMGNMFNVAFQKALLMQNSLNIHLSEVIQTFVYRTGVLRGQFAYATAVGLFNTAISFALLYIANRTARALKSSSLW